jgi:hypothetical protein
VVDGDDDGAKAVVGEAGGRVEEGVGGEFEGDECVGFGRGGGDLVWVVFCGKTTEAGAGLAIRGSGCDGEECVKVSSETDVVEGLDEGVDEVEAEDKSADSAVVEGVEGAARLGRSCACGEGEPVVE